MSTRVHQTMVAGGVGALLSFCLFLAALYLPIVGAFLSLFSAAPLLFISLYAGRREGVGILFLVTTVIGLLVGIQQGILFFVEYGIVALVLAEAIRRGWSPDRGILTAVGVSVGVAIILFVIYFGLQQTNPLPLLKQEIKTSITQSITLYEARGIDNEQIRLLQEYIGKIIDFFFYSFPAIVVIGSLIGCSLNYFTVYIVWQMWGRETSFPSFSFPYWTLPDYVIWGLIVAGFLSLLPIAPIRFLAQNPLLVILFFYLLQGFAIVHFYLTKWKLPPLLRGLGYFLLLIQPLFLLVITALGVFDLWVDFRRIRHKAV